MKKAARASPAKDVDEYLGSIPQKSRATLTKIRSAIRAAAPEAKEVVRWRMPMYYYHGMLIGFAAFKDHLSLFPGPAVVAAFKEELKRYDTSKGTIRFPIDRPIPSALVKKLVKARIKENEERARTRAK